MSKYGFRSIPYLWCVLPVLCGPVTGASVAELSTVDAEFGDAAVAANRFAARKGSSICVYDYAQAPRIVEQACIDAGGYRLRESRWSPGGDRLAIARDTPGGARDSVAVYAYQPATEALELLWSAELNADFPQRNSLALVGWIDDRSVLVSRGCGSSCLAFSIVRQDGYIAEPVGIVSDLPTYWERSTRSLYGVDRSGKLFKAAVDVSDPARPVLEYSDYFEGCLGRGGWYGKADNKTWYRYEEGLADGRILASVQPCDSGLAPGFAAARTAILDESFGVLGEASLGAPMSLSHDGQRIAAIKADGNDYRLHIIDADDLATLADSTLEGYAPDSGVAGLNYEVLAPVWSPDDMWIILPASAASGGAVLIEADAPSQPGLRIETARGWGEYVWISRDRFIATHAGGVTIYEVTAGQ